MAGMGEARRREPEIRPFRGGPLLLLPLWLAEPRRRQRGRVDVHRPDPRPPRAHLHPPLRVALVSLLTDPAGPLADCAAQDDDARTAYLLARIYRRARYDGVLHGKPAHEAEALFAQRVRVTARSSQGPF